MFTAVNWSSEQWVTVRSAQDTVTESGETATITHTVASGDSNYDGIAVDYVVVNVTDDDTAGVVITPRVLTLDEGERGTYQVKLGAQPSSRVTVTVNDPAGNPDVTANPPTLTFFSQHLGHLPDGDRDVDRGHGRRGGRDRDDHPHRRIIRQCLRQHPHRRRGGDGGRRRQPRGGTSHPGSSTIEEGDYGLYRVRLATQPAATVTVAANDPTDNNEVFIADTFETRTFTTSDWDRDQYVVFGSIEDTTYEAGGETATITHTVSSTDTNYDGVAVDDFAVTVTEDDPAPVVVIPVVNVIGDNDPTVYTPPPDPEPGVPRRLASARHGMQPEPRQPRQLRGLPAAVRGALRRGHPRHPDPAGVPAGPAVHP